MFNSSERLLTEANRRKRCGLETAWEALCLGRRLKPHVEPYHRHEIWNREDFYLHGLRLHSDTTAHLQTRTTSRGRGVTARKFTDTKWKEGFLFPLWLLMDFTLLLSKLLTTVSTKQLASSSGSSVTFIRERILLPVTPTKRLCQSFTV